MHAIVLAKFLGVRYALENRLEERKQVFQMMMVSRDHGKRFNPFDYLYDRYDMVVEKLGGYTYEIAEIEKALKKYDGIRLTMGSLKGILALEERLGNLPKPDDFDSRPDELVRRASIKDVSL